MLATDPVDALVRAHERGRSLREEATVERLRRARATGSAFAVFLRRLADHLDPVALAQRPD